MAVPSALAQLREPYRQSIIVVKGDTFTFAPQFTDTSGTPLDLTGCTAAMDIRAAYGTGATLIASATCTVTAATGTISCVIASATTAAITNPATLTDGRGFLGYYDIQLTDGTTKKTLVQGSAYLQVDVTT